MTTLGTDKHQYAEANLYCWIVGDSLNDVFPIAIQTDNTVGCFRTKIREENSEALKLVDAKSLILWKVCFDATFIFINKLSLSVLL